MTARGRVAALVGGLLLAILGVYVIAGVVRPDNNDRQAVGAVAPASGGRTDAAGAPANPHAGHSAPLSGLTVAEAGYIFQPESDITERNTNYRFRILSPDGTPLRDYRTLHEKKMHLIVVRRDFTGYRHVHPTLSPEGVWSVPLKLPAAGAYRVFADFAPKNLRDRASLTLGTDLFVPGPYRPFRLATPSPISRVGGYDIQVSGPVRAGVRTEVHFTTRRDGKPVKNLEPYLGAFGHLVALRDGDLAYLHMHPSEEAKAGERGGPTTTFTATLPTPGRYALFLDFKVGDNVFTAPFVLDAYRSDAAAGAGAAGQQGEVGNNPASTGAAGQPAGSDPHAGHAGGSGSSDATSSDSTDGDSSGTDSATDSGDESGMEPPSTGGGHAGH